MTKEAKAMNDYADGTSSVLIAVERWENEGGRVERIEPGGEHFADVRVVVRTENASSDLLHGERLRRVSLDRA
jgi:hypothetical protein